MRGKPFEILNSLLNNHMLDSSKLKEFVHEKLKSNDDICFLKDGNIVGKEEKFWFPACSPFPKKLSS